MHPITVICGIAALMVSLAVTGWAIEGAIGGALIAVSVVILCLCTVAAIMAWQAVKAWK